MEGNFILMLTLNVGFASSQMFDELLLSDSENEEERDQTYYNGKSEELDKES